jgi:hypothetical protein
VITQGPRILIEGNADDFDGGSDSDGRRTSEAVACGCIGTAEVTMSNFNFDSLEEAAALFPGTTATFCCTRSGERSCMLVPLSNAIITQVEEGEQGLIATAEAEMPCATPSEDRQLSTSDGPTDGRKLYFSNSWKTQTASLHCSFAFIKPRRLSASDTDEAGPTDGRKLSRWSIWANFKPF